MKASVQSTFVMKAALLLMLLVAASLTIQAQQQRPAPTPEQDSDEPLTRMEAFEARTGTVIVKNYTVIGEVSGFGGTVIVTSYEFVDAQAGRKEYGIGVDIKESGGAQRETRTYVDYDEIDGFIRGLDYIIKIERSTSLENFEAEYMTKGEVAAATFIRPNNALRAAVSIGGPYSFRRSTVFISLGKLADFRKLIADAKIALDKIR